MDLNTPLNTRGNEVERVVAQAVKLARILLWRPEFYPTPLHEIFEM